ncbi:hypothetical protein [Rhodovulum marinum]|uniref:Terminase small subunit n=1 Tax=Rhodovulum marinum TaxID=320662 RepID=A0A4R2PYC5_9RHOB|nr:hypothetical protein [Rhodovulum marinum]TCP41262.1 hypothetical protein EV662_1056 [Rhodovulum marinum]
MARRKVSLSPEEQDRLFEGYVRSLDLAQLKPRREQFARAFAIGFDGPAAAREAGYGRFSDRVWPVLLARPEIQARLRALRLSVEHAPATREEFVSALWRQGFADLSNLFVPDPETGGLRLDVTRARPDQLGLLDFEEKTVVRDGQVTRTLCISMQNRIEILKLLARHFGVGAESPSDDRKDELLTAAARAMCAHAQRLEPGVFQVSEDEFHSYRTASEV